MQAYSEILPPTAVSHAVSLPFLGNKLSQLVVAKASLLQIFDIVPIGNDSSTNLRYPSPGLRGISRDADQQPVRLALLAQYSLAGIISCLARVKILNTRCGGDALLVLFKDAKITLIEWDPDTHSISTISIHYYEGDETQGSPWAPELSECSSFLAVDPSNRCAALKFGQRHLAILPFRQPGDDLVMGDNDGDVDALPSQAANGVNGVSETKQTPYSSSFVLPLTALDPSLIHPVDLAFLYEYHEPTIGILSSFKYTSAALVQERKDALSYLVFTLDLEQRARTPLTSVHGLPYDIFKILPLPAPIGGALLVGGNELVHIDQAGRTHAIAVNEYAKQCSSFSMVDQSHLSLKLEGCVVQPMSKNTGETLFVLQSGALAILRFNIEGRSVAGLSMQTLPSEYGSNLLGAAASCVALTTNDTLFVGSAETDSLLLRRNQKRPQLSRKRSHVEMLGLEQDLSDESDDEEEEDELYGGDAGGAQPTAINGVSAPLDVSFSVEDRLTHVLPTGEPAFGRPAHESVTADRGSLDIVVPAGHGQNAGIAVFNSGIHLVPDKTQELPHVEDIWTLEVARRGNERTTLALTRNDMQTSETASMAYFVEDGVFHRKEGTEFEANQATINAATLCNGKIIAQVSKTEIRLYDADLKLLQIVPMLDESTDEELAVLHTTFCGPFLLVVRDNGSVMILKVDSKGEYEPLEQGEPLEGSHWLTGCLYSLPLARAKTWAFLLNDEGSLHIYDVDDLSSPCFAADHLNVLPPVFSTDSVTRRVYVRERISEILVANLGDEHFLSPFLFLRTSDNDVIIYEPHNTSFAPLQDTFAWDMKWLKVMSSITPRQHQEALTNGDTSSQPRSQLRVFSQLSRYSCVFISGDIPRLILKESASPPRTLNVKTPECKTMSLLSFSGAPNRTIVLRKNGKLDISHLPDEVRVDTGWSAQRIACKGDVSHTCYHASSGVYVVATNSSTQFKLPDDDWHSEWAKETLSFNPQGRKGMLRLLDPNDWSFMGDVYLADDEVILSMNIVSLETSEHTHERHSFVVLGTLFIQGEDIPARGSIYVFDLVQVVPEPNKPHSNKGLKLVLREDIKGGVTALAEIGSDGFLLAAQGQKCLVRGLKEDNSFLPVAFMDMQCYISSLKVLKGSGLALMADATRGVWLTGFSESPYRLKLFGKSGIDLDAMAVEFLPQGKQLFAMIADSAGTIHVLEFNPEHPKSLSGQRLLRKSTFYTGHFATSMAALPARASGQSGVAPGEDVDMEDADATGAAGEVNVLVTTQAGAMAVISPLDEQAYRRLGALQTHLIGILEQPCGLNPRAFRAVESEGFGGRGMLDGQILKRWYDLGAQRRQEACSRVGAELWEIIRDLEALNGGLVEYL